jgi:hypothetical protein
MKHHDIVKPILWLILIFHFLSYNVFAQAEGKLKELFIEAESYFLFEEYKDALPLYQRILQADPENFNINYKIGICYLNDIYQVEKSISYLEKAVKGTDPASKTGSFKERMAPPESYYYLGNSYRANNRLNDAIEAYEQFKLILDSLVYDVKLVDEQIETCKVASSQQSKPMYFISSNLGENINERFEEINPVVSGDESVLVFTRKLQFYDAVFCSRKENGDWGYPVNLTPSFAVDGNTYSTGLSYNGDELFVYRSDNFDGNIYVSHYRNGKWSKLEKLNNNINTKYWESHASLSKDGKTLYFTSNRSGGYGGLDIYKSERTRGDDWGPAINLGPVINSKYNEDTPFVTEDDNTLYFSSLGHYNMGGYDIFYSTRLDNGQWSKPINAGYPLNTTNNDLFFVPIQEGAFAYYSKYDQSDSYGLADIFKLEVFDELHPRKFILNGIARIENLVRPNYSQYVATLINSKTGKVFDQAKLNSDGTFTLNAQSGEFDLQIKGKGIIPKMERILIPVNNPSNIVSLVSTLIAETTTVTPADTLPLVEEQPIGPELVINTTRYEVTSNEALPIRLELERNTKLKVETFINEELTKTENFDIKRRRFVYMLTPVPGTNLLRFTLTNAQGDSTTREVVVIYTPPEESLAVIPPGVPFILNDSDRYMGLTTMAGGNLEKFLKSLDLHKMQFNSIADLYNYLIEHADENNYTVEDVDNLIARFLAQKDLNLFNPELKSQSSDSLVSFLENLNLGANNIYTSEDLLNYLYDSTVQRNFKLEELREALYKIASVNREPLNLIELLESYSSGKLAALLEQMKQNVDNFPDTRSMADYLIKAAENDEYPISELEDALRKAAVELNEQFLYQGLLFISSDSLKNTLLDLDMREQHIWNSFELITYLMNKSESSGYTKTELIQNIEKIRRDPYYYVDLFRKMLAEKATGSLKVFLQEIDVRGLKLNTFEDLIDYLLNQSQFHDFNRGMVYQLLIDIIDPRNVGEFIDLLMKYGDERITEALNATDLSQFSKPIEVVQYLLSVADDYKYTERDLLRILLKMLFRKYPGISEISKKSGWLANLNKPALVTTLVIVNAIIIALLIIFILRKKRKNEEIDTRE